MRDVVKAWDRVKGGYLRSGCICACPWMPLQAATAAVALKALLLFHWIHYLLNWGGGKDTAFATRTREKTPSSSEASLMSSVRVSYSFFNGVWCIFLMKQLFLEPSCQWTVHVPVPTTYIQLFCHARFRFYPKVHETHWHLLSVQNNVWNFSNLFLSFSGCKFRFKLSSKIFRKSSSVRFILSQIHLKSNSRIWRLLTLIEQTKSSSDFSRPEILKLFNGLFVW